MSARPKKKWTKYYDLYEGEIRYTFEERDTDGVYCEVNVWISSDRFRKNIWDHKSVRTFYTGYLYINEDGTRLRTDHYESLTECKVATEKLFEKHCSIYPADRYIYPNEQ